MTKALIIIDTQDSFYHTHYWQEKYLALFTKNLTLVVEYFTHHQYPIVKVLHREEESQSPFNPKKGWVVPMEFLPKKYNKVVYKSVHNAFTDTDLENWLKQEQIKTLVITGIRTEQCCETTARVASDLGFNVEFVTDATLTFDMTCSVSGNVYTAKEIQTRTDLVLAKRFADIRSCKDYI